MCIASACAFTAADRCLNVMPLFHVGGIARNVLAPLLSGGSVVCLPFFDPQLFWQACSEQGCTWYYAGARVLAESGFIA